MCRPLRMLLQGIVLTALLPCSLLAQPRLESLLPKAAPAFVLLDLETTSVVQPTTPADFAASLGSLASVSRVPDDFAVELSPYWLLSDRGMSWRQDTTRNIAQSFVRTFALSAASVDRSSGEMTARGLALGVSFALRSGRVPASLIDTLRAIEAMLGDQASLLQRHRQNRLDEINNEHEATLERLVAEVEADKESALAVARAGASPEAIPEIEARINNAYSQRLRVSLQAAADLHGARIAALDAAIESDPAYVAERDRLRAQARSYAQGATLRREGLHVEIAGGWAWQFADGLWREGSHDRVGVWGTISHEGLLSLSETNRLTPVGIIRYLSDESVEDGDALGLLDIGGRLVLTGSRYTVSIEGVSRTAPQSDDFEHQYRIAGIVEYEARSNLWIRAGFGRNFESVSGGDLIGRLGLTFSFTRDRYENTND
jgi:hypothetical protein